MAAFTASDAYNAELHRTFQYSSGRYILRDGLSVFDLCNESIWSLYIVAV